MSFTGDFGAWIMGYAFQWYPDSQIIGSTSWFCCALICAVVAYLFGSINCGVLLSKIYGKDVRKMGSGNAGTTNMVRNFGKKAGAFTFIGDFVKASIGLFICRLIFGTQGACIGGVFCIIGHAFPIYFGFKGGKGVVCVAAMGLFTDPVVLAIMLAIFAVILFGFKMVSFASVMSMLIYPFIQYKMSSFDGVYNQYDALGVICAFSAAAVIIFLHRKNIVRIFNHTESKISFGKKKR